MRAEFILLFLILIIQKPVMSQQDTIRLAEWYDVKLDNAGFMYMAIKNGDLVRKSPDSDTISLIYSPVKKTRISLLDVSNPLRTFLFYEDFQEYVILDRFLTETSRYRLTSFTSYAGMAAPAINNQLWLVDMVDFSIKKVDVQRNQVTIRIPLPQILDPDDSDFNFMREYQNLLFLVDRNSGIYLFDNLGNFLRRIEQTGVTYLHFEQNKMYYQVDTNPETLFLENFYSGEKEKMTLLAPARAVLLKSNDMWLFFDDVAVNYSRTK